MTLFDDKACEALILAKARMYAKQNTNKRIDKAYAEIVRNTPVRGGRAKRGWYKIPSLNGLQTIRNSVNYIKHLERGTIHTPGRYWIRRAIRRIKGRGDPDFF